MIKFQQEAFSGRFSGLPSEFLVQLDRMFKRIFEKSNLIALEVRTFVDATVVSKSVFLPDGVLNPDKDYFFTKTDGSANAVTVYSVAPQTIAGAGTYVLAAQYDTVTLVWCPATKTWLIK